GGRVIHRVRQRGLKLLERHRKQWLCAQLAPVGLGVRVEIENRLVLAWVRVGGGIAAIAFVTLALTPLAAGRQLLAGVAGARGEVIVGPGKPGTRGCWLDDDGCTSLGCVLSPRLRVPPPQLG